MARVPIPPASTRFVDVNGFLTPSAIQFLQPVLNVLQGLGGIMGPDALFSGPLRVGATINSAPSVWTPAIAGSATAGAQTYDKQIGWQIDMGPARLALFHVVLTALDGATAGNVQIAGLPVPVSQSGPNIAGWLSRWRATASGGYTQMGVDIVPGASAMDVVQSGSGVAPLALPVAGIGATAVFTGGALFFR